MNRMVNAPSQDSGDRLALPDGTQLFHRRFAGPKSTFLLVAVHGLGEHSGRYKLFGEAMAKSGAEVVAPDLRGHGNSSGKRGHVLAFSQFGDDLNALLTKIRARNPEAPWILLGHSLGGLVVSHWCLFQSTEHRPAAVILSSPALGIAMEVPPLKAAAGRLLSKWLPGLTMDNQLDPALLSRDQDEVKAYVNDPLVHRRVSTRLFTEMLLAMQRVQDRAADWPFPLMMAVGEGDRIVSVPSAKTFFEKVRVKDKTLKSYPAFLHEPFHEIGREEFFGDVSGWITARMK